MAGKLHIKKCKPHSIHIDDLLVVDVGQATTFEVNQRQAPWVHKDSQASWLDTKTGTIAPKNMALFVCVT